MTITAGLSLLVLSHALVRAEEPAAFFRGLNLNGPSVVIDGQTWEGADSANYASTDKAFENQTVALIPPTDPERAQMIRSSRWGGNSVTLKNVPNGKSSVLLYVWEDNNSETFSVSLNGKVVAPHVKSGNAGEWQRLGPWPVVVSDGTITLTSQGGAANFSGIELWNGLHDGSAPWELTPDGVAFFESRIRPLLIQHCYECHSAESKEVQGELLVDSRHGIRQGGSLGPAVIPGDVAKSLLIKAVTYADKDLQMPPDGKLTEGEIADLTTWVAMHAPDPRSVKTFAPRNANIDWEKGRDFWSLKPLVAPAVPTVKATDWAANEIDRFVLARLEKQGLTPAADADKRVLIRRVSYDLIGLPPTPEAIDAFLDDESPDAYRKVIDGLLASRQYGERWGRHWLDVVRYSDTAGDNSDFPVPQMYKYRNWVIEAFHRDLPYDQFVTEQLAGDLLGNEPAGTLTPNLSPGGRGEPEGGEELRQQRLIATGYIANARRFGSRVDDYPQHLTIEDTLDNLGRTFLATTINCARCHNHKFDPITADDYYALYGIFHSTRYPWPGIELDQQQRNLIPLVSAEEVARIQKEREEQREKLKTEVDRLKQALEALKDKADDDPAKKDAKKDIEIADNALSDHEQAAPTYELAYAVAESPTIEDVAIQLKGDPARPGLVVPRRFLEVLHGTKLAEDDRSSGRLALAKWITDPANPLTARVMANRIWQGHFGKAIAATPNDFGRQGKPPTHPELLDWLATRFIASGWSVKALHREIMLSRTYCMSSDRSAAAIAHDPGNDLLASYPRRRLDAEAIRDTLLLLGGNLDPTPGGPHPFPEQQTWKFTQHNPFKAVYETNRRSVYLMTQRIQRHPYLAIFDGPDPSTSTPARLTSTTPLQALYLLNDPFVHAQAKGLAQRLTERNEPADRVELTYRLALGRPALPHEVVAGTELVSQVRERLRAEAVSDAVANTQAWEAFCRAVFRLNEFVYVD